MLLLEIKQPYYCMCYYSSIYSSLFLLAETRKYDIVVSLDIEYKRDLRRDTSFAQSFSKQVLCSLYWNGQLVWTPAVGLYLCMCVSVCRSTSRRTSSYKSDCY